MSNHREKIQVKCPFHKALSYIQNIDHLQDLEIDPKTLMCAKERMILHRKEEANLMVMSCTLLANFKKFELGKALGL